MKGTDGFEESEKRYLWEMIQSRYGDRRRLPLPVIDRLAPASSLRLDRIACGSFRSAASEEMPRSDFP
jgi:hypothetical protein